MNTDYKKEFLKLYGNKNLSEDNIELVKELLELSGSKKYAEDEMNQLYDEAMECLDKINWLTEEKKEILIGFVEYLKSRNK